MPSDPTTVTQPGPPLKQDDAEVLMTNKMFALASRYTLELLSITVEKARNE